MGRDRAAIRRVSCVAAEQGPVGGGGSESELSHTGQSGSVSTDKKARALRCALLPFNIARRAARSYMICICLRARARGGLYYMYVYTSNYIYYYVIDK